jgi:hypothetical protein
VMKNLWHSELLGELETDLAALGPNESTHWSRKPLDLNCCIAKFRYFTR